jgi:hypothetical protein
MPGNRHVRPSKQERKNQMRYRAFLSINHSPDGRGIARFSTETDYPAGDVGTGWSCHAYLPDAVYYSFCTSFKNVHLRAAKKMITALGFKPEAHEWPEISGNVVVPLVRIS